MIKKRWLSVLLVVVILLFAAFTGCGKGSDEPSGKTPADSATDGNEKKEGVTPVNKEEVEISVALWDLSEFGKDEVGQAIADKLKVKINPVPLSWDNDVEQIKLFAATGEMPDIVATYTADDPARFYSWIDQGITRAIPADMVAKYPNLQKVFENSPIGNAIRDIKGEYRYIPRPSSKSNLYLANQQAIYYRKDWLANVGIDKVPETMDEFYQMLVAFKEDDPNQNGVADTYGFTASKMLPLTTFFPSYGIDPESWVKEDDGKWVPGYLSERNIEPLKYFQELYREGLLDPEFTIAGWKQAIQKITSGSFGAMIRNADVHWLNKTINSIFGEANPDVENPLDVLGVMGPLKKDADSEAKWPMFLDAGGSEISSEVDDAKLDRILELYEYLLSDEGRMLLRYGIENKNYKMNGDKIELINDPETNEPYVMSVKFPSTVIGSLADWDFDNDADPNSLVQIPQEYRELGKTVREEYNKAAMDQNLAVKYLSTPTKDTLTISYQDSYTQMIIGEEDIETAFPKFVEECMAKDLGKAIEEVNAVVKEKGLDK